MEISSLQPLRYSVISGEERKNTVRNVTQLENVKKQMELKFNLKIQFKKIKFKNQFKFKNRVEGITLD